jgi:hypothetical protein
MKKFIITEKTMRVGKFIMDDPSTFCVYYDDNMLITKRVKKNSIGESVYGDEFMEGFVMFPNELFCNLMPNDMFKVGTLNGVSYIGFHANKHLFSVGGVYSKDEDAYFNIVYNAKVKLLNFASTGLKRNDEMMVRLCDYINKFKKTGRQI